MDTVATDRAEPDAISQATQVNPEKHVSPKQSIDRFAEARIAKKKQKRARHRARLRRSHTDG